MSRKKQQSEDPTYWKNRDHLYIHYLYKITNKNNGKYYIGIHSILKSKGRTPENDNYYGSGTEIIKAIKEEGKENFIKEILKVFSTRDEAREAEKNIVTIDIVRDLMSYNRTLGGGKNNCGKVVARIKESNKIVTIDSEEYYNNKDFYEVQNNIVTVKLKSNQDGEYFNISKEEYKQNKNLYLTTSSGKVSAELLDEYGNKTGKYIQIDKEEYFKYKNIKYSAKQVGLFEKGKLLCKNSNNFNDIIYISKDDQRYLSGEYIPILKGNHLTEEQKLNKCGEKNGRFGTHWITNGIENKIVKQEENIPNGWKNGRTITISSITNKKRYKNINTGEIFYYSDKEYDEINNNELKPSFLFDKDNKYISKDYLISILNKLNISIEDNKIYFTNIKIISNYLNLYKDTIKKILKYYEIEIIYKECPNKNIERYCIYVREGKIKKVQRER